MPAHLLHGRDDLLVVPRSGRGVSSGPHSFARRPEPPCRSAEWQAYRSTYQFCCTADMTNSLSSCRVAEAYRCIPILCTAAMTTSLSFCRVAGAALHTHLLHEGLMTTCHSSRVEARYQCIPSLLHGGHDELLVVPQSGRGMFIASQFCCTAAMTTSLSFCRVAEACKYIPVLLHGGQTSLSFFRVARRVPVHTHSFARRP